MADRSQHPGPLEQSNETESQASEEDSVYEEDYPNQYDAHHIVNEAIENWVGSLEMIPHIGKLNQDVSQLLQKVDLFRIWAVDETKARWVKASDPPHWTVSESRLKRELFHASILTDLQLSVPIVGSDSEVVSWSSTKFRVETEAKWIIDLRHYVGDRPPSGTWVVTKITCTQGGRPFGPWGDLVTLDSGSHSQSQ